MENNIKAYPNKTQSWGILGISILMSLVCAPILLVIQKYGDKGLAFLIYYLVTFGSTIYIVHRIRLKKTGASSFNFSLSTPKLMLLSGVAVIGIQVGIAQPIVSLIPMPDFMIKIFKEFAEQKGIFQMLSIVIAAPILEEIIFRGIILEGLLKRYSAQTAILLSALLFGILHLNPWQLITAFLIGIFSGWLYYKTNKLSLSIFIHFVNNLAAYLVMQFDDTPIEEIANMSLIDQYGGVLNFIGITISAIIILLMCLHLLRNEFNKEISANHS